MMGLSPAKRPDIALDPVPARLVRVDPVVPSRGEAIDRLSPSLPGQSRHLSVGLWRYRGLYPYDATGPVGEGGKVGGPAEVALVVGSEADDGDGGPGQSPHPNSRWHDFRGSDRGHGKPERPAAIHRHHVEDRIPYNEGVGLPIFAGHLCYVLGLAGQHDAFHVGHAAVEVLARGKRSYHGRGYGGCCSNGD